MKPNFARLLKEIMEQQGLTQVDLATKLDMRQSQVSNWLNGKSLPGYNSIRVLSVNLGVSADELLEMHLGISE